LIVSSDGKVKGGAAGAVVVPTYARRERGHRWGTRAIVSSEGKVKSGASAAVVVPTYARTERGHRWGTRAIVSSGAKVKSGAAGRQRGLGLCGGGGFRGGSLLDVFALGEEDAEDGAAAGLAQACVEAQGAFVFAQDFS
jgi:hypothetical protein